MNSSFSISQDKVIIHKDGKDFEFAIDTVRGACLKVLIDNINTPLPVMDICNQADKIFKQYNKPPFADRGRDIRALHGQYGLIEKSGKGNYVFTGRFGRTNLNPFSADIKDQILKRDNYQCCWCGLKSSQGAELMIDHVQPESKGGKGTLENGMTLCTRCNNLKTNFSVHKFGKKAFERYLKIALDNQLKDDVDFFEEILEVFKKYSRE